MRMTWHGLAAASLMALATAGCSGKAALNPAQTGNREDTIKLAEFPERPY